MITLASIGLGPVDGDDGALRARQTGRKSAKRYGRSLPFSAQGYTGGGASGASGLGRYVARINPGASNVFAAGLQARY